MKQAAAILAFTLLLAALPAWMLCNLRQPATSLPPPPAAYYVGQRLSPAPNETFTPTTITLTARGQLTRNGYVWTVRRDDTGTTQILIENGLHLFYAAENTPNPAKSCR